MATKKYESLRIMSLEGSVVFKNDGFTATKDGKPDPKAFRGVLDESLDTLKLADVYDRHKSEFDYPYLDGKKRFCRAVVSLSFNRAIKLYESYGNRCALNGYSVTDEDMRDHVCISTVGGKPTLIATHISEATRPSPRISAAGKSVSISTPTASILTASTMSATSEAREQAATVVASLSQNCCMRI